MKKKPGILTKLRREVRELKSKNHDLERQLTIIRGMDLDRFIKTTAQATRNALSEVITGKFSLLMEQMSIPHGRLTLMHDAICQRTDRIVGMLREQNSLLGLPDGGGKEATKAEKVAVARKLRAIAETLEPAVIVKKGKKP